MFGRTLNSEIELASRERFLDLTNYAPTPWSQGSGDEGYTKFMLDAIGLLKHLPRVDRVYLKSKHPLMCAAAPTAWGRKFIGLLSIAHCMYRRPAFYRFDPHIEALWRAMEGRNVNVYHSPARGGLDTVEPWIDPDIVTAIFQDLGRYLGSAEFWNLKSRHEGSMGRHYSEFKEELVRLNASFPHSRMVRVESGIYQIQGMFLPRLDDRLLSLTRCLGEWLECLSAYIGSAFVAQRWKIDPDSSSSFRAHTVFFINGPADSEIGGIVSTMQQEWVRIAGSSSYCFSPSDMAPHFEYRGMGSAKLYGTPFLDELQGCAVFMAGTDRIVRVESSGMGASWGYKFDPSGRLKSVSARRPLSLV
jgi:hypothetical protein